jgi:hypothetical protein
MRVEWGPELPLAGYHSRGNLVKINSCFVSDFYIFQFMSVGY